MNFEEWELLPTATQMSRELHRMRFKEIELLEQLAEQNAEIIKLLNKKE